MKGLYLTEDGKKAIEDKIAEFENYTYATQNIWIEGQNSGMLKILEEIVSSATILPVEESWSEAFRHSDGDYQETIESYYSQGVIIQSKQ
jgi:hypothetical protein